MSIFELRLIVDKINWVGDFREQEIVKNLVKVELIQDDEEHKVYKFYNKDDEFFKYDFKTHKIVG